MNIRRVVTRASVWVFDYDRMMYVRFPRTEAPPYTEIPYTCEWEPFVEVEREGKHLIVIRPVIGAGHRRHTGPVVSDTHPDMRVAAEVEQ